MSDDNQFRGGNNQKDQNVLAEYNMRLTGEPINGSKRAPTLMVNVKRDGAQGPWNVVFEARTGVENDKDYGRIRLGVDLPTAFTIFSLIQDYAKNGEQDFTKVEVLSRRFMRQQNKMSDQPMLDGSITVGRTAGNEVFIGIKSWENDRPVCKFVFKPVVDFRRAVKLYKKDGTEWPANELSQRFAEAWVRGLGEILTQLYASEFKPAPPRDQNGGQRGGNGGGGWNNNRQQGGGNNYQQRPSNPSSPSQAADEMSAGSWDDDIPM